MDSCLCLRQSDIVAVGAGFYYLIYTTKDKYVTKTKHQYDSIVFPFAHAASDVHIVNIK